MSFNKYLISDEIGFKFSTANSISLGLKSIYSSLFLIDKGVDTGKIIAKKKVRIFKNDTLKKLEKRVLKEENKLYPLVLEKLVSS